MEKSGSVWIFFIESSALVSLDSRVNVSLMSESTNPLSSKQEQCLALVAQGWTSKEIAIELSLAARTVDDHVEKARIKLGAPSRQRAAALYREMVAMRASPATPDWAPYSLRREPPQVDELDLAAAIDAATPSVRDKVGPPFEGFPPVSESQSSASLQPGGRHSQTLSPLTIVNQVLAIAALLVVIILAFPQLVAGAETVAALLRKAINQQPGGSAPR